MPSDLAFPLAYFITYSSYGARIHGSPDGSVDRFYKSYDAPLVPDSPGRVVIERNLQSGKSYSMDAPRRSLVLAAIRETCGHRSWNLLVAHVRTNHVHVIVHAETKPEPVMNALKAYASRKLNFAAMDPMPCKRWARHGSTRYLWKVEDLETAMSYVTHEQGKPMALYVPADLYDQIGRIVNGSTNVSIEPHGTAP